MTQLIRGFHFLTSGSMKALLLLTVALLLSSTTTLAELAAQADKAVDDQYRASCTDWYGNARLLFVCGCVFALLGYELDQGRMIELRRINYAPVGQP